MYRRFQAQRLNYFDSFIIFIGYSVSEQEFVRYADILFQKLGELHRLFDIFNPYEGVNNLYYVNANASYAPVVVERPVIELLTAAKKAYDITGGKTNVAAGSVLRIWHEHRQSGSTDLPSMDALIAASYYTNIDDLIIDVENSTVFFRRDGMSLDVGAIAKGFAAGLAMDAVIEAGIPAALLSAGGHIVAHGIPTGRDSWNVGVQNPNLSSGEPRTIDAVAFTDASLSISGDYERFFEVDGVRLGHIIDLSTLMPAQRFRQVALLHESSWMADILSTAIFILPFEEGYAMAAENGADALWIDYSGLWMATDGYRIRSAEFGP